MEMVLVGITLSQLKAGYADAGYFKKASWPFGAPWHVFDSPWPRG
jgi:hypothetical protein